MFVAMNRFKVVKGSEEEFEAVWRGRKSQLDAMPGFRSFHMLKGPEREDHRLYASHTVWASRSDFEAWTRSQAFRDSHSGAPRTKPLYLGHPDFEGFEAIPGLELEAGAADGD